MLMNDMLSKTSFFSPPSNKTTCTKQGKQITISFMIYIALLTEIMYALGIKGGVLFVQRCRLYCLGKMVLCRMQCACFFLSCLKADSTLFSLPVHVLLNCWQHTKVQTNYCNPLPTAAWVDNSVHVTCIIMSISYNLLVLTINFTY